jgi:dihydrofolate reductase
MTRVHTTIDGDAFFPAIVASQWKELSKEEHSKDEKHIFPFSFITYQKI